MFTRAGFFEEERQAPLLQKDEGFLERSGDDLLARAERWLNLAGVPAALRKRAEDALAGAAAAGLAPPRIVVLDAVRTFRGDAQRRAMERLLTSYLAEARSQGAAADFATLTDDEAMREYHQGLGYLGGLLLLLLPEASALALLLHVRSDVRFLPGYWRHEAVAFATDAYVFDALLERRLPDVASHLRAAAVPPETFLQKWFVGLCIHVLPFEPLFAFLDAFFARGFRFLFLFGLALMRALRPRLLATRDAPALYAILRLEPRAVPSSEFADVPRAAAESDAPLDGVDFADMRRRVFEEKLRKRMEASASAHAAAAEAEDDDADDEEADSVLCDACETKEAVVACGDCNNSFFCQACHEKGAGEHKKSHAVSALDSDDESSD